MTEQVGLLDLLSLSGKSAIVTGGGAGIGHAIAARLAQAGAAVTVADVSDERAKTVAEELVGRGYVAQGISCDVSDVDAVQAMVDAAVDRFGGVDILVNNAGIFPTVLVMQMRPADFDRIIDVNLRGVYLCTKTAAEHMINRGRGGKIINITSIDALHPSSPGLAHYDASKHGVWGFTKNLALELAPYGIWVNAIAPGAIATPGVERMQTAGGSSDTPSTALLDSFLALVPMHRMGVPDDIARVALFLAGDLASYMTGAQIVVDGGRLLS